MVTETVDFIARRPVGKPLMRGIEDRATGKSGCLKGNPTFLRCGRSSRPLGFPKCFTSGEHEVRKGIEVTLGLRASG